MSWKITYVGEGVRSLGAVGAFQRGTRATVSEAVAKSVEGDKDWQVTPPGEEAAPPPPAPAPAAEEKPEEAKADDKKADAKADDKKADDKKKKK